MLIIIININAGMCAAVVAVSYFTFMFYYFCRFYCQVAFVNS